MQIKKQLPAHARVEQLKKQSKDLLSGVRAGQNEALERVRAALPRAAASEKIRLADAQLVVAREYGFSSWTKLKYRVEAIDLSEPHTAFAEAACVPMDGSWHASGNLERADAILSSHPQIAERDVFLAAIVGNDVAVRRFVEANAEEATATGGLYDWDPLTYVCFSRYLRLDPGRSAGLVRTARYLLEHGASAETGFYSQDHEPEPTFETALYGAAGVAAHAELTELLLDHGANPNDGETAYHVPERYDNDALKVLVESGKVDADSLATMLTRKHDWHDYDGIAWLLAHGADPNRMSYWGRRGLHQALERDNPVRFLEALLDAGADPMLPDKLGKSAIARAARMGRGDVLELFERRGFPELVEPGDALLAACARGDEVNARAVAAQDPGLVERLETEDRGILADMAGAGNVDAVRILLDLGFDIASRTSRGGSADDTALHIAIWRSRHSVSKLLIDRGAPLEVTNRKGETPLAHAVRGRVDSEWTFGRSSETIAALLEAGAKVEPVSRFPSGNEEVDELLRRHGKV